MESIESNPDLYEQLLARALDAEIAEDWVSASNFLFDSFEYLVNSETAYRYVIALWKAERFELSERETVRLVRIWHDHQGLSEHLQRVTDFMKFHHVSKCVASYEANAYTEALRHAIRAAELWPDHPWVANYKELCALRAPGFEKRTKPGIRRIFIAGCGRSGTYLLSAMMQCFRDSFVLPGEAHADAFLGIDSPASLHVIKRRSDSYSTLHLIPRDIGLLHIVRHPFDVLCSSHMGTDRYIPPENWNAEIDALRLLDRQNHLVIRYEDLVSDPNAVQRVVSKTFGLGAGEKFSNWQKISRVSDDVAESMHGVRPPDTDSIGRWKNNSGNRGYIRAIWPDIERNYRWVAGKFGYEPFEPYFTPLPSMPF